MPTEQLSAWRKFVAEMPWLCESDRAIVELACRLRAAIESGKPVASGELTLYRQTLAQLGGTPADRHRVTIWPTIDEEEPSERNGYFAS